jgi:YgiT-type zinc finger domain-containing protein
MKYEKCECGGEVIEKKVRFDYRRGDKIIVFEKVPVGVCKKCGERIYDAKVLKALEFLARSQEKPQRIISVPVMRFSFAY